MSTIYIDNCVYCNVIRTLSDPEYRTGPHSLSMTGYDLDNLNGGTEAYITRLAVKNWKAYRARYAHWPSSELADWAPIKYMPMHAAILTPCELVKALYCIAYNIDEQDEDLDKLIRALERAIVHNLEDYKAAPWG